MARKKARRNARKPSPQMQKQPRSLSPSPKEPRFDKTTTSDSSHTRSRRSTPSESDSEVAEDAVNERASGLAISTALEFSYVRRRHSTLSNPVIDAVQEVADEKGYDTHDNGRVRRSNFIPDPRTCIPVGCSAPTEDHDYVSQLDEIEGGGYAPNTTGTLGVDGSHLPTGLPLPLLWARGHVAPSRALQDRDRSSNPIPGGGQHDMHGRMFGGGDGGHDAIQQYASRPPLLVKFTGYRILNSCALLVFGTWKGVAAYQGNAIISNTLDVVFGVVLTLSLYWLGHFEAVEPPCLTWLFHDDYAAKLLPHRADRPRR